MSKLDKKFFGENVTADNWNKESDNTPVIKIQYDEVNSITLPKHEDELEEVISTSFNLQVECTAEKLAAKVMLANQDELLAELGLNSRDYTIKAEEKEEDKEVVVTIAKNHEEQPAEDAPAAATTEE